jgi:hypothetical protein
VLTQRLGEMPALLAILRLLQLTADHGRSRVEALAACLFDERTHDVSLDQGETFCQQMMGALGKRESVPLPDELPTGSLGAELTYWCEELVQQSHRAQRRALELFAAATPLPLVESWAAWWSATRKLLARARDLKAQSPDRKRRSDLRNLVDRHRQSAPPKLLAWELLGPLREADPASSRAALLARVLAKIPAEAAADRPRFLVYWSFLGRFDDVPDAHVAVLLAGFERYLSQASLPAPALLLPWKEVVSYVSRFNAESVFLETEPPRSRILAAYDHLAATAGRYGGLSREAAVQAIEIFLATGDPDLAARMFDSLRARGYSGTYFSPAILRIAIQLCRERPEHFGAVLMELEEQGEDLELPPRRWPESLFAPLGEGALGEMTRELIVSRQLTRRGPRPARPARPRGSTAIRRSSTRRSTGWPPSSGRMPKPGSRAGWRTISRTPNGCGGRSAPWRLGSRRWTRPARRRCASGSNPCGRGSKGRRSPASPASSACAPSSSAPGGAWSSTAGRPLSTTACGTRCAGCSPSRRCRAG